MDCIEWTGALDTSGYGCKNVSGKTKSVHRLSYAEAYGDIPDGMCVLHKCDNRKCYNPKHLFLGTKADNNRDRKEKGRNANTNGDGHPSNKLSADQVREIRRIEKFYGINTVLGKAFGVHHSTISKIRKGVLWASI